MRPQASQARPQGPRLPSCTDATFDVRASTPELLLEVELAAELFPNEVADGAGGGFVLTLGALGLLLLRAAFRGHRLLGADVLHGEEEATVDRIHRRNLASDFLADLDLAALRLD